jgi:Mg-chelatase subunit ChlI
LDRFALSVEIKGIADAPERMEIIERHIAYEDDAEGFRSTWAGEEKALADRIAAAREIVEEVEYSRRDLYTIASLTSSLKIDGHRADMVVLKTARAHAAYEGRRKVTQRDILLAMELTIPHRLKRGPFADAQMNMAQLEQKLEQVDSEWGEGDESAEPSQDGEQQSVKKNPQR